MRSPNQHRKSETSTVSQADFVNAVGKTEEEVVAEKQQNRNNTVEHKGKVYELASVQPEQPRSAGKIPTSKKVWVKNNIDQTREKRKRNVHGTAINVPLHVEEFRILEAAHLVHMRSQIEKGIEVESFSEFIREALVRACSKQIGAEARTISEEKINQIMVKTEEMNSLDDDVDKRTIG